MYLFLFLLHSFSLFADDFSLDQEPDYLEEVWDYSEWLEAPEPEEKEKSSGLSRWRFRSDKPNAETFGTKTNPQFINPLYLYNRTSFTMPLGASSKFSSNFIFLRRDETSQGASEPPVTAQTWRKHYFLRHAAFEWEFKELKLAAGDYLFGWGQGLFAYDRPGSSFRPFLLEDHGVRLSATRSSYENIGVRGAALSWKGGRESLFLSASATPLDGRVDHDSGNYLEDLAGLQESLYGELGRELDFIRRDRLHENSLAGRFGIERGGHSFGFSAGHFAYDRFIQPQASINVPSLPNRWDRVFHGNKFTLMGFDWSYSAGSGSLFLETAVSRWDRRAAPALTVGGRYKGEKRKHTLGTFYVSPRYFSRLADGPRLDSGAGANRYGAFSANTYSIGRQHLGWRMYLERNIKSDFSGHSASHSPYESRWHWQSVVDDRVALGHGYFIYSKTAVEAIPYLIDAKDNPVTISLFERKSRLEAGKSNSRKALAFGWDHAHLKASQHPAESSHGDIFYARSRLALNRKFKLHGKFSRFELGPPLFGQRFLYMSSSEFYWMGLALGTIAYQSLFASYAPRGVRVAAALEEAASSYLTLWLKLGVTRLDKTVDSAIIKDSEARDDLFSRIKLDFKTECVIRW